MGHKDGSLGVFVCLFVGLLVRGDTTLSACGRLSLVGEVDILQNQLFASDYYMKTNEPGRGKKVEPLVSFQYIYSRCNCNYWLVASANMHHQLNWIDQS